MIGGRQKQSDRFCKEKLAGLIVGKKFKSEHYSTISFQDFFKKSFTFLVLMPDNDTDFHYAIDSFKRS